MGGWTVQGHNRGAIPQLPPGLQVAGLGGRVGAWLLDGLIFGFAMVLVFVVGAVLGAVKISPEAANQLNESPNAQPTVPLFDVNMGMVSAVAALSVVVLVLFATVCWMKYRGTPGQRIVGLQVADITTGRNLSAPRAFLRALILVGLWWGAIAVIVAMVVDLMGIVAPAGASGNAYSSIPPDSPLAPWMGLESVASLVALFWPIVLLVAAAVDSSRRGLHDRVAGSIVVGNAPFGALGPMGPYGPGPYGPYGPMGPYGPGLYGPGPYGPPGWPAPPAGQWPVGWPPPGGPGALPGGWAPPPAGSPPPTGVVSGDPSAGRSPTGAPPGSAFGESGETAPQTLEGEAGSDRQASGSAGGAASEAAQLGQDAGTARPGTGITPGLIPGQGDPGWSGGSWPAGWGRPGVHNTEPAESQHEVWQATSSDVGEDGLPVGLLKASFGRRAGAYAMDSAVLFGLFSMFYALLGAGSQLAEKPAMIAGLLGGACQIVYFVGGWVVWRGTPGQRLLGIQIGHETTGRALSWGDAFVRWAVLQGPFALSTIMPFAIRWLVTIAAAAWAIALAYSTMNAADGRGPQDRIVHCLVAQDA